MEAERKPLIAHGWVRAVIYFIGVSLIVFAFSAFGTSIMDLFKPGTEEGAETVLQFGLFYAIMGLFVILFTWVARKWIDKKSFKSLGFTWKGYSNEAGLGFFLALALLGIGTIALIVAKYLVFTDTNFEPGALLLEAVLMIVVAFVEELIFRGYLLNNLMQSTNKWIALVITAVLFAVSHNSNPDVSVYAIVNIFLAGVLMGLNYIFTQSLWFGICFHFAWNYFQGPVLGYEVSGLKLSSLLQQSITGPQLWTGGPFGFEGSLLCPLLFVVGIIVFSFAFIKRYEQA